VMPGGEFLNQAGYSRKLVPRQSVRNDEHSTMGALVIEELNREPNKIIPISGHQTSFLCRCKVELPLIRCLAHPSVMSAKCVNPIFSKYFGNLRAEVFIQVKFHEDDLIKG
jgi:hypothetical protein